MGGWWLSSGSTLTFSLTTDGGEGAEDERMRVGVGGVILASFSSAAGWITLRRMIRGHGIVDGWLSARVRRVFACLGKCNSFSFVFLLLPCVISRLENSNFLPHYCDLTLSRKGFCILARVPPLYIDIREITNK